METGGDLTRASHRKCPAHVERYSASKERVKELFVVEKKGIPKKVREGR